MYGAGPERGESLMQRMRRVSGEIEWRLHEHDDVRLNLPRSRVFDPAKAKVSVLPVAQCSVVVRSELAPGP